MFLHGCIVVGFILINEANSLKGIEESTRKGEPSILTVKFLHASSSVYDH